MTRVVFPSARERARPSGSASRWPRHRTAVASVLGGLLERPASKCGRLRQASEGHPRGERHGEAL